MLPSIKSTIRVEPDSKTDVQHQINTNGHLDEHFIFDFAIYRDIIKEKD